MIEKFQKRLRPTAVENSPYEKRHATLHLWTLEARLITADIIVKVKKIFTDYQQ